MLLEYLEDPDAQLHTRVLMPYSFVPDEVGALRNAIDQLSRGKPGDELRVDTLPGVTAVDGSSLAATSARKISAWSQLQALTVTFAAR
jgi:hypothetical protein